MSGLEVCASLKQDERYRSIPIIIFSGKGRDMDERLCRECGANAYISKPAGSRVLIEQIEALLSRVLSGHSPDDPPPPRLRNSFPPAL